MSEQAGREMDARVAEEVMGWRRVEFLRDMLSGTFYVHDDNGVVAVIEDKFTVFSPSTSIKAAWEVVEKTKLLERYVLGEWEGRWAVQYLTYDDLEAYVTAPTAPLAICLAALKAVREETA